MTQRLNLYAAGQKALEPMLAMEAYLAGCGLERGRGADTPLAAL